MTITGLGNGYTPQEHIVDQTAVRNVQHAQGNERENFVSAQELDAAAKDMERITLALNKQLRFTVDRQTDEVVVKVIDPETDKVIKELPPEELQRLHRQLKEMIGLLIDETA
jgi:flagellar protein FlaG